MSKYKTLQKALPGKRLTKLLSMKKVSQMTYRELFIYSTLFRRGSKGASLRFIRRNLLSHLNTIKSSLAKLKAWGLVEKRNGVWFALAPETKRDWFGWQRESGEVAYNWVAVPANDSPLSPMLAACLSFLILKHRNGSAMSKWLGVSARTVGRAKHLLRVGVNQDWFADKGPAKQNQAAHSSQPQQDMFAGVQDPLIKQSLQWAFKVVVEDGKARFFERLLEKYPPTFVDRHGTSPLQCFLWGFQEWYTKAKREHLNSVKMGTHQGPCLNFLIWKLNERK